MVERMAEREDVLQAGETLEKYMLREINTEKTTDLVDNL